MVDFNHISKDLTTEEVDKLKGLYSTYHRSCMCYKWEYARLGRVKMALDAAAMLTTTIGVVAGGITMNPIVLGCIGGAGILAQSYMAKSDINNRAIRCKHAYVTYERVLSLIKNHLRGLPYDESSLLTELRVIDEIVVEQCPPLGSLSRAIKRYSRKYGVVGDSKL